MTFQFQNALDLPELLRFDSGGPVRTAAQWPARRDEVHRHVVPLVYGAFWPVPELTRGVELHSSTLGQFGGARLITLRVEAGRQHAFLMQVFVPNQPGPMPAVVSGDGCWRYATDQVITEMLRRNYIFAQFNRVEVAPDPQPEALQMVAGAAAGGHG